MANLKMLKHPKQPKAPKKPSPSASLRSKQAYLAKIKELRAKYFAKVKAIDDENTKRKKVNEESKKLTQVISGIEVFPSSFKAVNRRLPRPGSKISGINKRKKTKHKVSGTRTKRHSSRRRGRK